MTSTARGAAAVEFALVLPILVALVLGIVEFGYLLFLDASAAGAAREGAREMAITQDQSQAQSVATSAFSSTTGRTPTSVVVPGTCTTGDPVVVSITLDYPTLTGFFGSNFTASGTGEMRCGG